MAKAIGELLQAFWAGQLSSKAPREAQMEEVWTRIVGPHIAEATSRLRLTKTGLTVVIRDPLVREEVRYRARSLVEALQAAGFPEVKRLRVQG